ncbi:MAG: hypothetical protein KGS00_06195 [Alphaproteobacteria bacterium]|nr:hypothetical protein [Alphaproteobacteria bacterium]
MASDRQAYGGGFPEIGASSTGSSQGEGGFVEPLGGGMDGLGRLSLV